MVFTTLAHHIDIRFLLEACRRTRKDGAVGVDGQTARDYAEDLEENLQSLLDRFKSGRYRAPPVRRVFIPKGKPSMSGTFWTALSAFGRAARPIRRCGSFGTD
jgi:retron-type reverse transcriptase